MGLTSKRYFWSAPKKRFRLTLVPMRWKHEHPWSSCGQALASREPQRSSV